MKFTIALALLGAASATTLTPSDVKFLQVAAPEDEEVDHSGEFFEARDDGTGPTLDNKYERVIPERFTTGSDDIFMRSMLKNYALEGKNKDGTPNGKFFMNEANARAASKEVLSSHKNLKGGELQTYMQTYFGRTWKHFDVLNEGRIDVDSMPQFVRFLASDQSLNL